MDHCSSPPSLTRKQLAAYLTERGYPIALSTWENYHSRRSGPPVKEYWGRVPLYSPDAAVAWAKSRARPAEAA